MGAAPDKRQPDRSVAPFRTEALPEAVRHTVLLARMRYPR